MSSMDTPRSGGPRPPHAWTKRGKLSTSELQQDILGAVKSAFDPHPSSYRKAIAVLMHFENDDIGCEKLEDDLAKTFENSYGYNVRQLTFRNHQKPVIELTRCLMDLDEKGYNEENCLIILVVSGHGATIEVGRKVVLQLGGSLDATGCHLNEPTLDWGKGTRFLEDSPADVLHILDCCYAAEAVNGTAEVIAATSATEIAEGNPDTCFTQGLDKELMRVSSIISSAASLHSEMMRNRRALGLNFTPFYAEREGRNSVVLRKMAGKGKGRMPTLPKHGPRILVTAHIEQALTQKDSNDIKKWLLTEVPAVVKDIDIRLEGLWDSESTMLLFSIPIAVWTQLPNTTAWSYVGTVTSHNKLLQTNITVANPLAIRPLPGTENAPAGSAYK